MFAFHFEGFDGEVVGDSVEDCPVGTGDAEFDGILVGREEGGDVAVD